MPQLTKHLTFRAAAAEAGLSQIRSKMASAGWTPDDVTSGDLDLYDSLAKRFTTCGCSKIL